MYYVLLTSDVIGSRKEKDLDAFFEQKLSVLNAVLKKDLITKMASSRGDEIQFIIKFNQDFFKNIMLFRCFLNPLKIRTGAAVIKDVDSFKNLKTDNSWELNGKDFFLVRDILDKDLKKEKRTSIKFSSTLDKYDSLLNSFFTLNDYMINEWSDKHWQFVQNFFLLDNNKELSKKLNLFSEIKQQPSQTFYDRLHKTNVLKIKSSIENLVRFFEKEGFFS